MSVPEEPATSDSTHLAKAVVLVAVVVLLALFLLHRQGSSGSAAAAKPTTTTTTTTPGTRPTTTTTLPKATIPPNQIKLQVLNGLQTGTLAGQETTKLASSPGYLTLPANDTTVPTTKSVVYSKAGYYDEGLALAATVGLPSSDVRHRIPKSAPLPTGVSSSADLILVIGNDLAHKV